VVLIQIHTIPVPLRDRRTDRQTDGHDDPDYYNLQRFA